MRAGLTAPLEAAAVQQSVVEVRVAPSAARPVADSMSRSSLHRTSR